MRYSEVGSGLGRRIFALAWSICCLATSHLHGKCHFSLGSVWCKLWALFIFYLFTSWYGFTHHTPFTGAFRCWKWPFRSGFVVQYDQPTGERADSIQLFFSELMTKLMFGLPWLDDEVCHAVGEKRECIPVLCLKDGGKLIAFLQSSPFFLPQIGQWKHKRC